MKKVFFTSSDGEVWGNKTHLKEIIRKEADEIYHKSTPKRLADLLIGYLDTLYYKEEPGDVKLPADADADYFYCGSCRRGFPVRYTDEMVRMDCRPCPTCGAQSRVTPKLGEEKEDAPVQKKKTRKNPKGN